MKKYENDSDFVFEGVSNTKFNAYLKEIADVIGIEFILTHHIVRKTFALLFFCITTCHWRLRVRC